MTIKSLSGGSHAGTANPIGSVARTNQNAITQPPTVIIKKSSVPCFLGMPLWEVPNHCKLGDPVQASMFDVTIRGIYYGVMPIAPGNKYMMVEPSDHWAGVKPWGCGGFDYTGNFTQGTYDGLVYTKRIDDMMKANASCMPNISTDTAATHSAAQFCLGRGPTYYLPTYDQMKMVFDNKAKLGNNFQSGLYWTSHQESISPYVAIAIDMTTGARVITNKRDFLPFRCAQNMP